MTKRSFGPGWLVLVLTLFSLSISAPVALAAEDQSKPDDYGGLSQKIGEWILDLHLGDGTSESMLYQTAVDVAWDKRSKAEREEELRKYRDTRAWWENVQRMTPKDQAHERNRVIANAMPALLASTDPDDRMLVDFCRTAHPELIAVGQGYTLLRKGANSDAVRQFTDALRLDSKNIPAILGRGEAHLNNRDYDRAMVDLTEVIHLDPDNAVAFYERGVAHEATKNAMLATRDFDEALRLDPKLESARSRLAARESAQDHTNHDMTIEEVEAQPERFARRWVTFRGVAMNGELRKNVIPSTRSTPKYPVRFFLYVISAANKRYRPFESSEFMFSATPEMAAKLAQFRGLVSGRFYKVTLTGVIDKIGLITSHWALLVTQIDLLDDGGRLVETFVARQ